MLSLRPVRVPVQDARFDLVTLIEEEIGEELRDGDVLVVSSKFVAMSEGRVISLGKVKIGNKARALAAEHRMDPRICELVLRESDRVIGGIPGFLLASKEGLLTPNAGIDKSNVRHGAVILYPRKPEAAARTVREALMFSRGVSVGVVICDSRLSPTRRGTTGVAVGSSGIEAIQDMRGRRDLFGNVLKVTAQAVADDLSSAAEVLMGESDEATPIVLVRGLKKALSQGEEYGLSRFAVAMEEDVFLRSLGFSGRVYA
ncbi:MAG: coenzyme F420-0:L-glutamate ligase [Nitrososphaerota archaeon]|nr:coenzyme F420-0:L-glutamate ligase [Nitrososphaerota archaeon]MDG6942965.1 coenzyme F420-0:L-glutamate ligase [Nitrososphaerota archaeon]MDG6950693.1 coenzyme F420-0:L-glutamate ligase [Nitrososphaerota archaeon]